MNKLNQEDIRWLQRLDNFKSALDQLGQAVDLAKTRELSDLEKQGIIQSFEFTHELAWNVIRDYFLFQGQNQINGSRDATREAFQKNLISDGEKWMEMIKSRNLSSHTYNKKIANEIVAFIIQKYYQLFCDFYKKMKGLSTP